MTKIVRSQYPDDQDAERARCESNAATQRGSASKLPWERDGWMMVWRSEGPPAMGHRFGMYLICACRVNHSHHQQQPAICALAADGVARWTTEIEAAGLVEYNAISFFRGRPYGPNKMRPAPLL